MWPFLENAIYHTLVVYSDIFFFTSSLAFLPWAAHHLIHDKCPTNSFQMFNVWKTSALDLLQWITHLCKSLLIWSLIISSKSVIPRVRSHSTFLILGVEFRYLSCSLHSQRSSLERVNLPPTLLHSRPPNSPGSWMFTQLKPVTKPAFWRARHLVSTRVLFLQLQELSLKDLGKNNTWFCFQMACSCFQSLQNWLTV